MKIYDNWKKAFEDKDFDGLMKFYHPDYSFVKTPNEYSYEFIRVVSNDERYGRE